MQKVVVIVLLIAVAAAAGYFFSQYQIKQQVMQNEPVDSTEAPIKESKSKKGKGKKFVSLHVDSLAVHKGTRQLFAFSRGQIVLQYNVALGVSPVGKKEVEGDNKTPEGLYRIDGKNPFSTYHKSLGINYPNAEDREHAEALGQKPGGDIKIHGLMKHMNNPGKSHIKSNWTAGCIAITDDEIDELYSQVKVGIPISIQP